MTFISLARPRVVWIVRYLLLIHPDTELNILYDDPPVKIQHWELGYAENMSTLSFRLKRREKLLSRVRVVDSILVTSHLTLH